MVMVMDSTAAKVEKVHPIPIVLHAQSIWVQPAESLALKCYKIPRIIERVLQLI